jgi:hypothetical protein
MEKQLKHPARRKSYRGKMLGWGDAQSQACPDTAYYRLMW